MKPRRGQTKVTTIASATDHEQQAELIEQQRKALIELQTKHRDQVAALELQQRAELHRLEMAQLVALGELWQAQGRDVGPGLLRVIERGAR